MKRSLLAMLVGMLTVARVWAAGPGTTSAEFLNVAQGVRPTSLGEAYTGLAQGLDTLTWNPAGLAGLENPAATFMHNAWLQDTSTEYLAYGMPLGDLGAFAAGVTLWQGGTVQETFENSAGDYNGTGQDLTPMSLGFVGGYAQTLGRWWPNASDFLRSVQVGASLKVVSETYGDTSIFGGGLELGALWRERSEGNQGWRAGFAAQNLGATSDQSLPITFRVGSSYVLPAMLAASGQGTFVADLALPVANAPTFSLGGEYAYGIQKAELAARVGYKVGSEISDLDALAGLTAGLGVAYASDTLRYQLDYALVPYGDLGLTHRLAITVGFLNGAKPAGQVQAASAEPTLSSETPLAPAPVEAPAPVLPTGTSAPDAPAPIPAE
jgi:hypothetical protein